MSTNPNESALKALLFLRPGQMYKFESVFFVVVENITKNTVPS
jgi:hypothetical protein